MRSECGLQKGSSGQRAIRRVVTFSQIIGSNATLHEQITLARKFASNDFPLLLNGETGTGKDLFALAIHFASARSGGPFVAVNCPNLGSELMESELFGHVRGAFTGALRDHKGFVEQAESGTLFLNEINSLPMPSQGRVLHLLQTREFQPVGAEEMLQANVRIICATNANLGQLVRSGQFREDLFYRINVLALTLPPLRSRPDDIPALACHFVAAHVGSATSEDLCREQRSHLGARKLSQASLEKLIAYHWPGNVRELENTIIRALVCCPRGVLDAQHVSLGIIHNGDAHIDTHQYSKPEAPAQANSQNEFNLSSHHSEFLISLPISLPRSAGGQPILGKFKLLKTQIEHFLLEAYLAGAHGNVSQAARDAGIHRRAMFRFVIKHQLKGGEKSQVVTLPSEASHQVLVQ